MKRAYFLMSFTAICVLASGLVFSQDDIEAYRLCQYCGMDRGAFGHSRVLVEYDDGTSEGTCSLHCAAIDLAINIDKSPKAVWVGDYNTKTLVDVEKAFWVVGGSRRGVMTKTAKWAFARREDAEGFVKKYGGRLATFDEAIKAAYLDMYEDTRMVREMRKIKSMMKTKP
ncbi:MAG: nitrous oxide reductase accessory protein NosL [Thermodesulfobacteriota bacterium]|nr:nitrous oxide reductase accessory protein NosL [Thermodesulfobacteriota bacterium]